MNFLLILLVSLMVLFTNNLIFCKDSNNSYYYTSMNNNGYLQFNENNQFKIIQFTDLHFGEGESVGWGPEQDKNSTKVMNSILEVEYPVDLIVFSGDLITGNNIINNATVYWQHAIQVAIDYQIPWIITFGNHDDLASGSNSTRQDLMKYDIEQGSLSQFGPLSIPGLSNYYIDIKDNSDYFELNETITRLWVFDSGDGNCPNTSVSTPSSSYQCNTFITEEQVNWYLQLEEEFEFKPVFSMSFFHIPLQEYMEVWNNETCYGWNNDSVACQPTNTGLFNAFEKVGNVKVNSVGHNHGNDYCGTLNGIELCFGRHSGYGGYGTWEKGARVFQLSKSSISNQVSYQTWIRFETGDMVAHQLPHLPNNQNPQTQCTD